MTTIYQDQSSVDPRAAALTMAVAVLVERIRGLSREDQEDLFDLNKALCAAETEEEVRAAAAGLREILDQSDQKARRIPLEEELKSGSQKWLQLVCGKIRSARTAANLTQEELAMATGLPQSHISRLENEQHSPSRVTLEKIAGALGIPLSHFDPTSNGSNDLGT